MFLSTTRPDGRPHTAGIGALWHDGDLYFTSNPDTRKSRDLAANPACTIAMRLPGIDLVFEGEAARTTDPTLLEAVAALFREGGWPAQVEGGALTAPFSAPSAGPPPVRRPLLMTAELELSLVIVLDDLPDRLDSVFRPGIVGSNRTPVLGHVHSPFEA